MAGARYSLLPSPVSPWHCVHRAQSRSPRAGSSASVGPASSMEISAVDAANATSDVLKPSSFPEPSALAKGSAFRAAHRAAAAIVSNRGGRLQLHDHIDVLESARSGSGLLVLGWISCAAIRRVGAEDYRWGRDASRPRMDDINPQRRCGTRRSRIDLGTRWSRAEARCPDRSTFMQKTPHDGPIGRFGCGSSPTGRGSEPTACAISLDRRWEWRAAAQPLAARCASAPSRIAWFAVPSQQCCPLAPLWSRLVPGLRLAGTAWGRFVLERGVHEQ